MKYSVTTVALPHLTMQEQAKFLADLGYDGIELRVRPLSDELRAKAEPSNWGYHVNDLTPENFRAKAAEVKKIITDNGLQLVGLATAAACTDLEQIKQLLDGAVLAGAPFIRVGAAAGFNRDGQASYRQIYGETVAGYERVLELTRGTGVKVVLEIHGGTIHPSASFAFRIVSNFDPADVGVIYDPQNMIQDGFETTSLALQLLGGYVAHLHIGAHRPVAGEPDATGTVQWSWQKCRLAQGLYNYPELIRQLKKIDYSHFISVEDFDDQVSPEEKFADAIAYLRRLDC